MSQIFQYYKSFQNTKSNNTAPTFEDLSIDDNLTEIERVVRYCKSTIGLQRLVHVKMLGSVASSVGYEVTHAQIVPLLEALAVDFEPAIRCHLCEQITIISKFCIEDGNDAGYQMVLDMILPVVAHLLEDDKVDVRHAASTALVSISNMMKPNDLGQYVLTIILQLAHEDENEEMRMTASELLNLLAELLGFDLCKQFVIPEVVSLAEDPVFRVRKSTALNFQNVCKIGGEYELFERLMPAFVRLSKDDMYRVRRACAESLCEISKHVSDDIRTGVLVEIFLRLAQDPSKLVKQSVLQQSGMFISTLPKRVINKTILDHYCNMVNNPTGDHAVDAELKHYCAYSFPGVLQTVGVERWTDLRQVYHGLVRSSNPNVKQTLALSLHEVAKILGMKLAEEELVAVFEDFIQDSEDVKMGVIKHLAEFLQLLSMPCRVSYLPLLDDILLATSPFNWRLRKALAAQLSELVKLPPPQNVFNTLFPLAMTLVQDPVAEVRLESFKGVARMMRVFEPGYVPTYSTDEGEEPSPLSEEDGTQYLNSVSRAINALVHGETYHHRQLWANLCLHLLKELPRHLFEKFFVQGILLLTSDSVANVRVSLSEMLAGWEPDFPAPWEVEDSAQCPWKWLMERSDIRECIVRLASDDNDVFLNVSKLQPLFPEVTFEKIRCVGLKRAPGGVIPVGKGNTNNKQTANAATRSERGEESSDSSVGAGQRSASSSISSDDDETPDPVQAAEVAEEEHEEYDSFSLDDQAITATQRSQLGKAVRRCTPSPESGLLSPEDIVVMASDEGEAVAEGQEPEVVAHCITASEEEEDKDEVESSSVVEAVVTTDIMTDTVPTETSLQDVPADGDEEDAAPPDVSAEVTPTEISLVVDAAAEAGADSTSDQVAEVTVDVEALHLEDGEAVAKEVDVSGEEDCSAEVAGAADTSNITEETVDSAFSTDINGVGVEDTSENEVTIQEDTSAPSDDKDNEDVGGDLYTSIEDAEGAAAPVQSDTQEATSSDQDRGMEEFDIETAVDETS